MWLGAAFCLGAVAFAEFRRNSGRSELSDWGSFVPQVAATLIGAAIAGIVSYDINRRSRISIEKDAAIRLIVKLKLIADDYHSILNTIDRSLEKANEDGMLHLKFWQRIRPIAGLGEPIIIEAAEAAAFIARGKDDIANRTLLLSARHRTLLTTARLYNDLNRSIHEILPPKKFDGKLVSSEIPKDKSIEYDIRSTEIEEIIKELTKNARIDLQEAIYLCNIIGPAAKEIFADPYMPALSIAN